MRPPHFIIRRPLLTEKGTRLKEALGERGSVALFEVAQDANKIEIKQAIESLFSVKVKNVHTINVRGKEKRVGQLSGMRAGKKKALVTLAAGSKIEFFEGA